MNFKTTAVMLVLLGGLLVGVFVIRNQEVSRVNESVAETPPSPAEMAARPLFDPPLEDVVKIVFSRSGQPDCVFEMVESEGDAGVLWRLTSPFEAEVPQWEANGIVNRLKGLRYQIVYRAGQDGAVGADEAGLAKPRVTVGLFEKGGREHKVRIGLPASDSTHYLGAGDSADVFVVQGSLDGLLKRNVYEYRDRRMFGFDASSAVAVEFNVVANEMDDESTTYRLVQSDGDWRFEEPFADDAIDKVVVDAIDAMSGLRASAWVAGDASTVLARYGFAPPRVDIEVTCEETVAIESSESDESVGEAEDGQDGGDASSEPVTETVIRQYRLLIASRSPLGQDKMVYAKLDTDGAIATITRTIADKMTPAMETWRDMTLVRTAVSDVERLTITSRGGEPAVLSRNDLGLWVFEGSGRVADGGSVRELVRTISELDAFAYVEHANVRNPEFGLVDPAIQIEVKVKGEDKPAVIRVGNPTDPVGRRAYYLQRGDSKAVAKVRSGQAEILLRSPISYRDRDILKLAVSEIRSIRLDRLDDETGQYQTHAMTNDAGTWRLTVPFAGDADLQTAANLAARVADLRAITMVPDTDVNALAAIKHPRVIASIVHAKPSVIRAGEDGEAQTSSDELETVSISIGLRSGKVYARRADRDALFEIPASVLDAVEADVHSRAIWSFEMSQVKNVTVKSDGVSHGFGRGSAGWYYLPEPALPIDAKKVDNLVLQLGDLKLKRYVAYDVTDLRPFGLDNPARSVTISTDEGRSLELFISDRASAADGERNVFAAIKGWPHVFLLTPATVLRVSVDMDEFERDAGS